MVTKITVYAVYNAKINARAVSVTGQVLRGSRPVPETLVRVESTWGESALTETTLNYGSYSAVLPAPRSFDKQTVTVRAGGVSAVVALTVLD